MAKCVKVAIDDIVNKIDKPYDYFVPDHLSDIVADGLRVIVPFSRANTRKKAFILSTYESDDVSLLKPIISVVDKEPLLTDVQKDILKLLKNRYFVTYYRALKTLVPQGIDFIIREEYSVSSMEYPEFSEFFTFFEKVKGVFSVTDLTPKLRKMYNSLIEQGVLTRKVSSRQKISDKTQKKVVLKISKNEVEDLLVKLGKNSQKQIDLLSVFIDYDELSLKDALYYSGCSESTINTLVKKGVLEIVKETVSRNPYNEIVRREDNTPIILNSEQKTVFDSIISEIDVYKTHLIHGVTGSGKTLVYMSLIDEAINNGKSVIFMVPEISLTPQMLERFYNRYGDKVAVIHSGLAPGERADEWKKIRSNTQSVIVGTRSAVFSPVNNLGLIIIDEEHESSYKSESSPRFHARDISKFICKKCDIPLILGSATPSVESCYLARKNIYRYHTLKKRFNNNPLPKAEIIDMTIANVECEQSFLSEQLRESIEENLRNNEQTILFLNRRGTHTLVGCRSCGYVEKCPNCGIALTFHSANNRCMCHYCGYNVKMYDVCPKCSSKHIMKLGVGTQLVTSEIEELFPDARILRMDFDTVGSYIEYGRRLNDFKNGEYDIMLGTQMVAKGLDFPNVTLVGIINADISLHVDDFRANERTFSLLTQVCGRSGRAGKEGRALIQTYSPDCEIIHYAKHQDYDRYFDFEVNFRKAMNYPPFCDLVQFTVSAYSERKAYDEVMKLYEYINRESKNSFSDIPVRLLYPTAPKIVKFNKKYRYNLSMKTKISNRLYELLNQINSLFSENDFAEISINVNPMSNV